MGRTPNIKALIRLLFFMLPKPQTASGKVLEQTYLKWVQYKQDCVEIIKHEPLPQEGSFCNRTFDSYACWPDTPAGSMVNVSCPFYLPWFDKVSQGFVRRRCGSNGLWETDESGHVWRDISECEEETEVVSQELWLKRLMVGFRTLYTVGYSLSLSTLIMALIIILSFRKLRCTRNYIHANLFLSFILRAVAVIVKDTMLDRHLGREIAKHTDVAEMLSHQAAIGCRIAQVMMQYCVLANHYWFFGEAIYLYSVLISCVFTDNNKYLPYLCLGWGTPLVFVVPWVVMKVLKENKECWAVNENMNYWWIIRLPVLAASLVMNNYQDPRSMMLPLSYFNVGLVFLGFYPSNIWSVDQKGQRWSTLTRFSHMFDVSCMINFLIFMKILGVIFSKLRGNIHSRYPDYKLRLAKATLTLIPLFGIHEMIFIFATDEQTTGALRYIKVFFTLFISSFQGLLVAVLYCYANKEVQTELRRKFRSWRTETAILVQ